MQKSIVRKLGAGLLLAALVGAGAVAGPRHHHGMEGHGAYPMHHMQREMRALHDKLALTPEQQVLWERAEAASKDAMQAGMERHRQFRDAMRAAVAAPNFDPRALAGKADDMADQDMAAHRAVRSRWLDVYDKLDAKQKATAQTFMQERLARFDRMREHHREHMKQRMEERGERHPG
ncbi:MAG: periplasmic heavy metal sensor [Rhodocyclaceae bacterium]|nr:periplasmic heavy metal sensor [Rhodocyclaceae bacterium]